MCKLRVNIGDVGILSIVVFVFDYFKRHKFLSEPDSICSQLTLIRENGWIFLNFPVIILRNSFETGRRACASILYLYLCFIYICFILYFGEKFWDRQTIMFLTFCDCFARIFWWSYTILGCIWQQFGDWSLLNGASGLHLVTNYIHSGFIPNGAASLGGSGGGSCGNCGEQNN